MGTPAKRSEAEMPPKLKPGTKTERVQIVATDEWLEQIDDWRSTHRPLPSRSEAIRVLVEYALVAGPEHARFKEALQAIAERRHPSGEGDKFADISELRDYAVAALLNHDPGVNRDGGAGVRLRGEK